MTPDVAIRVGLLGFGEWARTAYVPALRDVPGVRLTAVAARSDASRRAAAEAAGTALAVYADFAALLAEAPVDAVMIALPRALHAEAIEAAIGAGKHVFFEPPVALARPPAERLLDRIARAKTVVQADLELRYSPVMDAVTDSIHRGEIGDVRMARVSVCAGWGCDGALSELAEDGAAFVLAPWYLDLLDAVIAEMPERAQVIGGSAENAGVIDHGWMALYYRGGRAGCFEINLLTAGGESMTLDVWGSHGEIHADLLSGDLCRRIGDDAPQTSSHPALPPCGFVGMRECVQDFFHAISERRAPRTTPEVLRRLHEAIFLCAEGEPG